MQALGQRPDTRELLQMVRKVKKLYLIFLKIHIEFATCRAVSEDQTYDTIEFNEVGKMLNTFKNPFIVYSSFYK